MMIVFTFSDVLEGLTAVAAEIKLSSESSLGTKNCFPTSPNSRSKVPTLAIEWYTSWKNRIILDGYILVKM